MAEWCVLFSSSEAAARAVAGLGGFVSSFCWKPEGALLVTPLPEKEEAVRRVLSREGIICDPGS